MTATALLLSLLTAAVAHGGHVAVDAVFPARRPPAYRMTKRACSPDEACAFRLVPEPLPEANEEPSL